MPSGAEIQQLPIGLWAGWHRYEVALACLILANNICKPPLTVLTQRLTSRSAGRCSKSSEPSISDRASA